MELNEKVQSYIDNEKYGILSESDAQVMQTLLTNTGLAAAGQLPGITEASLSGDVAQFTPILMPVVRRVYLKYVMITRARKTLNMIDEGEIHPNLWFSNTDYMYKELKNIRNKIQNKLINYEN